MNIEKNGFHNIAYPFGYSMKKKQILEILSNTNENNAVWEMFDGVVSTYGAGKEQILKELKKYKNEVGWDIIKDAIYYCGVDMTKKKVRNKHERLKKA